MKFFKYIFLALITLLSVNSFSQTMPASGVATGASLGSWTIPANVYSIKIDSWGGGGAGSGRSTTGTGGMAGGAGGSRSSITIAVTPGQTIYYNIAAARAGTTGNAANGNDTWVNKSVNSAPSVSTNGVLAKGGQSAVGTTAGIGSITSCIGTSNRGGSGRVGGTTAGGGGSSAGTTLDGTDATGTAGAIAPTGGGSGGTGHASGGNGTAGSSPGGGGGGAYKNNTTGRSGGGGAAGRVILTYQAIPVCATITSPLNGSTDRSTSQTLSWGAVSGATSYDVYFGTNSTPPLIGNQVGTTYNPGTLLSSTIYYWKIIAKNAAGSALSCSTWNFTTKAPGCLTASYGLYPSTTYTPSCNGSVENITTTGYAGEYSNVNLTNGVSYTFSSSNATDYITISNSAGTTVLSFGTTPLVWTSTISGDVRFYVHTNDACTEAAVSRSRRIQCSIPPNCTTPTDPLDGATLQSIGEILNWNTVASATSYDVYFGTSSNPPFIINQIGNTYIPSTLSYNTTYYWKIVPKNAAGGAIGCSIWSFSTGGPGCLVAPYGQYPSTTYNPNCSSTPENITTTGYAGEYSVVNLISNVTYTMSSSVATDFITISDLTGSTILAYGTGSVSYSCLTDGNYRFYVHTNESCGSAATSRSRKIQCSTPPPASNDLSSNAEDVGLCGGTFYGTTKFSTQAGDGPDCYSAPSENWTAPGVWYSVVGNGKNITASLCGSSYDTKIYIYTGTPGSLICLTYNDDFCGSSSQVTFASTLNTTYYILVTGYDAAKGSFTFNVSLAASPPVISTQPTSGSVCSGQSRTFSVVASGNQGPMDYQWYLGGVAISGATSSSYIVSTAGTYYVIVSNSCGATTQSSNAILTVNPLPNITVLSPEICNGFSTQITAGGGVSYVWSTGATTSAINVSPITTTNYSVIGTDANGCQSQSISTVSVNSNPLVSLNSSSSQICSGGSGTNNIIATATSGTPTYSYQWQYYNGSSWLNTGTNTNILNATPTVTREYRVVVTDIKGCQVISSTHIVNVIPDPINPTLNTKTPNQNDICVGTNVSSTFNPGTDGVSCGDVYQFSVNSGVSWSTYTPGNNISTSGLIQGTTVQIRGRRTNCATGIGCSSNAWSILSQWTIVTPPILSTSSSQISCSGGGNGSINLTVSGSVGPFSFNWTGPNGFTSNLEDITNLASGNYTVVVSSPSGCSSTTSVSVSEPSSLVLTLVGADALCSGASSGNIDLTVSGGTPSYSYLWSNGSTTQDLSSLSAGSYTISVTDNNSCVATSSIVISQPSQPILLSTTTQSVICNGSATGSVNLTVTGGVAGYTYNWSNSSTTEDISNLISGNYSIIVTDDNGCQSSTIVVIDEPTIISSSITSQSVTCFGGSNGQISLTVSGGTSPYTYLWSSGQTTQNIVGITAGNYSVTITDSNGCSIITSTTITQPTIITALTTKTNVSCYGGNNGSSFVTASGGTSPYLYSWSNGYTTQSITNLIAGNYNISVTDSKGCIKLQSVNISQPNPVVISVNSPTISNCQSVPVILTTTITGGTSPYTYLWSTGETTSTISVLPTSTTVYTITVNDINGCASTSESTITVSQNVALPSVGSISGPEQAYDYMLSGNTATYSVSPVSGASNYIWYIPNNGVSIIGPSNTNVLVVQFNGNYIGGDFLVTAYDGCSIGYSDTLHVSIIDDPLIGGSDCGIPSGSIKTYVILNPVPGLTYNWSPPYGVNLFSGQGNDTCKLKFSTYFQSMTNVNVSVSTIFGTFYGSKKLFRGASAPTQINGYGSVCADGSTIYTYYVDSVPSATSYIWGIPSGCTLLGSLTNDTIRVKFSTLFMGSNFTCMAVNQCGSSAMRYYNVYNSNVVFTPGTISGPIDICPYMGTTATFSVANNPGYTFNWTPPTGVTVNSGQGTNIVQLNIPFGFTSGSLNVNMNNGCGNSNTSTFNMTTTQQSIVVSNISGLSNPCSIIGSNQTTPYSITPLVGVTYNWLVPADMQIVSGQGTNSIQAKFLSGFSGGTASLVVTPNCGNPAMTTKDISPVYPAMNLIGTNCIENGQSYNYYINLSNVSSYNIQSWNWVAPTGAVITSGQGTSSIMVSYPANFESNCLNNLCDSLKCFIQFPCGTKMMSKRIGMTTYPVATITGPVSTCGPDTIQLSASSSNRATIYYWGNVNGTTFISINGIPTIPSQSQTVNSKINTTFLGSSYNVQAINQCGSTAMRYFYVAKDCTSPFIVNSINETSQSITTIDDIMTSLEYVESNNKPLDFITFPNPGKDIIHLRVFKGTSDYYLITINNLIGQNVYQNLHASTDILNISALSEGIFFITIESKEGYKLTKEMIIKK